MSKPTPDNVPNSATSRPADDAAWRARYQRLSAADKQKIWREYYAGLSDAGKLKVWQEYHDRHRGLVTPGQAPGQVIITSAPLQPPEHPGDAVVAQLTAPSNAAFTVKGQLRSVAIGLGSGAVVVLLFMFTLFNEAVITPFIQPSQKVTQAPPVDAAGVPIDPEPRVRIPEINVDIPVIYGLVTTDAKQFELALDQGVVHYPTTALPGQAGNAAFFGHSSNNIFNPGKYKFAFILLHELAAGDTFHLTYNSTLYTYEVISRKVVRPSEVGVLGDVEGQTSTATLITCDPPGTSNNRLVVVGKQVSPAPAGNDTPVIANPEVTEPPSLESLPGNGPGLLHRLYRSVFDG